LLDVLCGQPPAAATERSQRHDLSQRLGSRLMDVTLGHMTTVGAPLSLSESERRRHLYISGKTGTGKSTLLLSLMQQDLAAGRGFALIDPHGDLAQTIADAVPRERIAGTIYVDPLDETHAVGFNPLQRVPQSARPLA